ncbi:hypothetical protein [Candidatus Methylomirabilis sp.]|uniref:hypothetical protein n=1 Tax=Candidatus Methylomirabilis sp. TaxID=2032687 RepID=UPI003C77D316
MACALGVLWQQFFFRGRSDGVPQPGCRERLIGRISNTEYQDAFSVSKPTATRDLEVLRRKQVLVKVGHTGKGTHYVLNPKGLTKGSKGSHTAQRTPGAGDTAVAKSRKKQSTPTVKRSMKGTKG